MCSSCGKSSPVFKSTGIRTTAPPTPEEIVVTLNDWYAAAVPLIGDVTKTNYGEFKQGDTVKIAYEDYLARPGRYTRYVETTSPGMRVVSR